MEEYDLDACKEYEKAWKCPIDTCMKILTRKQTLQTHLSSIHGVEGLCIIFNIHCSEVQYQ